ncbi:hypothetical protein PQI51_09185 [Microbacterium esteraromaticum]|uniref:hypothetical protein n=1 Tax=Microbacterium esteraromaticum TaxID=57043 RepID=UPI0030A5EA0F
MKRLARIVGHLKTIARGWVSARRLRAETLEHLVEVIVVLRTRLDDLETEIDEVRADSRRVAELRIQVEDYLADRT